MSARNIDPTGRLLVAANYARATLPSRNYPHTPVRRARMRSRLHWGSIDAERQTQSHPHQAVFVGGQLVVVDLGADVLRIFEVDPEIDAAGALRQVRQETVPPGSGPRHLVALPDGRVALSCEPPLAFWSDAWRRGKRRNG